MARVVYIEKHEGLAEVVRHLEHTSEQQVILVVPKQASLFISADQLAAIKSKGDKLGKHITIISLDARGLAMAEAEGLEVSKPKKSVSEGIEHPLLEEKRHIPLGPRRKTSVTMRVVYGVVVVVVLIGGGAAFWYATMVRTDIYIKVTPKPFSSNIQIAIDSRVLQNKEQDGKLIIPGRVVAYNRTISETFPSSGKKSLGDTASGEVTFFNFTEDTLALRGEDTVLRHNNLRFKLKTDVLRVRPTAFIGLQGKKIDPTSLVASQGIQAEEMGEAYNMPSGTKFEVINAKLNLGSSLLYAQNSSPLAGGFKKEVRVIDAADVDTAVRTVSFKISQDALSELSKLLQEGEKIVQDKSEITSLEKNLKPALGSEADTFTMTASARVSGLAYNRMSLEKLVANKIKASVPSGTKVDHEDQMVQLSSKNLDIGIGRALIANDFSGMLRPDVDNADVKYTLRGKTEAELKEYFKNVSMVESVEVKFTPTWLPRASWLSGSIFISME